MITDRDLAEAHAREYHAAVNEVSADGFAPNYKVWSWDEMPPENRDLLVQASLLFLGSGQSSAEQLSIALMAEARRMYQRAGTIGHDEHGFRAEGDRFAEWASHVRKLGVELAKYRGSYQMERLLSGGLEAKLKRVRALAGEWARVEYGQGFARELLEALNG